MNEAVALLPMRAGSQRVKNKNTVRIGGRPLYDRMLDTLQQCRCFERIVINTDIPEVLERFSGSTGRIVVQRRPEELRGNCSMNLVIEDCLSRTPGEHFVQLHATNPLLGPATISAAVADYLGHLGESDSLFTVTRFQKRLWNAQARPFNHDPTKPPTTQDLEVLYEENSCLYAFSRTSFGSSRNRVGARPRMFVMDSLVESIDVDTEEELRLVESILVGSGETG